MFAVALAACAGDALPPVPEVPARLLIVSDSAADGRIGGLDTLMIRVVDETGRGVPGQTLSWTVVSGSGLVRGRADADFARLGTGRTDRSGHDWAVFAASATGPNRIEVRLDGTAISADISIDVNTLLIRVIHGGFYSHATYDASTFTIPLGAAVEWRLDEWWGAPNAHVVSVSAPTPAAHFDSGVIGGTGRPASFRFLPAVAGTWEFVDRLYGGTGALHVLGTAATP